MCKITSAEIKLLISDGDKDIYDKEFVIPEYGEVRSAVDEYIKSRGPVSGNDEKDDCDNRAAKLWTALMGKGWDVAFIGIPGHAICGFIDRERKWRYFEPLDGKDITSKVEHVKTYMM